MATTPADPTQTTLAAPDVHAGTDKPAGPAYNTPRTGTWWRHALALLALAFAFFPIVFIVSSAFNNAGTLSTSGLWPTVFGTDNFDKLFSDPARPYTSWYKNSLIISTVGTV